jgi:hypothetical protein
MKTNHEMPLFATKEDANKAMDAFNDAVRNARDEHGIHDVTIIAAPLVRVERDGEPFETHLLAYFCMGSTIEALIHVAEVQAALKRNLVNTLAKIRDGAGQ